MRAALDELEAPDAESRSPEAEGRRIIRLDEHRAWGWEIVNYLKYRAIKSEDDRREQNRAAQQVWRDKKKSSSAPVINHKQSSATSNHQSAASAHTEAEAEGEVEGDVEGKAKKPGAASVCCPTLSDSPASAAVAPPAASRTQRGQRLPKEWALPKGWGDEALVEFTGWTVEKVRLEASKFRDHWIAKAGKDAVKLDWHATWRNWCRSDIAHRDDARPGRSGPTGGAFGNGPKTPAETEARNREAMRLLGITPPPPKPPLEYVDG